MYICKVCGYDKLEYPQYDSKGYPTYIICSCCGFESGFHDGCEEISIEEFRIEWIEEGSNWFSTHDPKPVNWDWKKQIKRVNN